jgi:hypothetical protein
MRLWNVHPRHFDPPGLVAAWREGLLAQAVLRGRTRGYTRHPQLARFRAAADPVAAIAAYLRGIHAEATARGYRFDASRIARARPLERRMPETRGQFEFEWKHLMRKLRARNPGWLARNRAGTASAHPIFRLTAGGVRDWERV